MKKNIFFSFILVAIFSCTQSNDDKSLDSKSIFGTWKLVGVTTFFGTNAITDGYTYTFNNDNTFTSNRFLNECSEGVFTMSDTTLTLDFDCEDFTTGIESPPGTFIEEYRFENNRLILNPTYLDCTEGCLYKFKKIAQP
jgi:hypothetical protein